MNGIYFVPILAVVLCAMLSPRMPSLAAKVGLIAGLLVASGYFVSRSERCWMSCMSIISWGWSLSCCSS